MSNPKPVVLAVLSGWGVAPEGKGNAISQAKTPNFDRFVREYPTMLLQASDIHAGLSEGEVGNAEAGHLNIGAGRIYPEPNLRINQAIADGSFFENKVFLKAFDHIKKNKSSLHLMGLLSSSYIHSNIEHLLSLLEMAKSQKCKEVYLHLILDGRDIRKDKGEELIIQLQEKIKEIGIGKISSVSGRYYAMDRDNHWDRTSKAYRAIAEGISENYAPSALEVVREFYKQGIYDEQIEPTVIGTKNSPVGKVENNDAIIFFNFLSTRSRQLTRAFVLPGFAKFERQKKENLFFVTMTDYEKEIPVTVAFPNILVVNSLPEIISKQGLKQLHIAETERYAHVTYFFNGLNSEKFENETQTIIPSKQIQSYSDDPSMSAAKITKEVTKVIDQDRYDFIIVNFANVDLVAHDGNIEATVKACETVDKYLGKIYEYVSAKDGVFFVVGDHGNGEEMIDVKNNILHRGHTKNPVPFCMVSENLRGQAGPDGDPPSGDLSLLDSSGTLADVAPTILKVMGIEKPREMTGRTLI